MEVLSPIQRFFKLLNLDRQILTEKPELVASGVTQGVLCYVRNENVTEYPTETAP